MGDTPLWFFLWGSAPRWTRSRITEGSRRERIRQLRLHALETLGQRLIDQGRPAQAIEVGLAAVAADPLRESAHRVIVSAHLAEGNRSEALRQYRTFERLLDEQLGVGPSDRMLTLIGSVRARGPAGVTA